MQNILLYLWITLILASCGGSDYGSDSPAAPQEEMSIEYMTDRPDVVWGFDFLPTGDMIFTQRSGGIFTLSMNTLTVSRVQGGPDVSPVGEGGMLDLKVHPDVSAAALIYYCYTEPRAGGRGLALARSNLLGGALTNTEVIFRSNRSNNSSNHFGCRIEFESANKLYLSTGEQSNPLEAQNNTSHLGKILKMNADGSGLEVWSSGHRNVQGLAIRPGSEELFASEHGPTGGDELNRIQSGNNYGWPLVTSGTPPGTLGESAPGFTDPLTTWTPAIAPSGMTFWKGDLYIATLVGQHIHKLSLNGFNVENEQVLFQNEGKRFRNLRVGRDGLLYFSTDSGDIGRIK